MSHICIIKNQIKIKKLLAKLFLLVNNYVGLLDMLNGPGNSTPKIG